MTTHVITTASGERASREAAAFVAKLAIDAIERKGNFVWAVSGGATPARFLTELAQHERIDWCAVHLFQVDERVAASGSPDRNDTMIRERLVSRRPDVHYHPMPVEDDDLPFALIDHLAEVEHLAGTPAALDLVQLGLGNDGHTASLVEGDPALRSNDDLAITLPYRGTRRVTMTAPLLNRASRRLFLVTGAEKDDALSRLATRDPQIPGTLITMRGTTLITDRQIAGFSAN